MGEIADALRRARSVRRAGEVEFTLPSLRSALGPVGQPSAPQAAPAAERWVETVEPDNEAVVFDEGPNAELCRQLAIRLRSALDARGVRSLAVVSAERGDGKTTLACNLAIGLATLSRGRDIALLDLDLRKPSLARQLSIPQQVGIEEVLRGGARLDDVLLQVRKPAIDVYAAISPHRAAHELLVLPELREMIAELERRYSTVIIDTPPALLVPDANLVLRHVSACVPVVRAGKTRTRSFRRLMKCLPREQLVGWILNCDRSSGVGNEAYYYGEEPEPRARWRLGWSGLR